LRTGAEKNIWAEEGQNNELHDLYSSPSIIRMSNSRRMKWMIHIARKGEKRNMYRLVVGKLDQHQDIGGWITLRWNLEIWDWLVWTGLV
jgi:hypothetical protein